MTTTLQRCWRPHLRVWLSRLVLVAVIQFPLCVTADDVSGLQAAIAIEQTLVDAIARSEKSVVAIARVRNDGPQLPLFNQPLPFNQPRPQLNRNDPTSPDWIPNEYATGVIIDGEGFVVTAYHALGDPRVNDYYVWVGHRPFRAEVKAGDPWTDLAVLKIDGKDLQPITLGDAKTLKKGNIAITLGNPYAIARDGDVNASWGIISNLSRSVPVDDAGSQDDLGKTTLHHYGTLIQTDAKLNLGTSGGALLNLKGEMVGLTTALAALEGYEKSAGFAIPVDDVFKRTVATLKKGEKVEFGFLGVGPVTLSMTERQNGVFGARIDQVVRGTPAEQARLRNGDIITRVNEVKIHDRAALMRELSKHPAGEDVELTVLRDAMLQRPGRTISVAATLSKKYIPSERVGFAQIPDPVWRGMSVDYPTAIPQQPFEWVDPAGCVAVSDVEIDSPAWKAGMRPGRVITHVNRRRVSTPKEFFEVVATLNGDVKFRVMSDEDAEIIVSP